MIFDQPIHQEEDDVILVQSIPGILSLCQMSLSQAKKLGKPGDIIYFEDIDEEIEYSVIFD